MNVTQAKLVQSSDNLQVTINPVNYVPLGSSLSYHLQAIDNQLTISQGYHPPPINIADGFSYKVSSNTQVLYVIPITIDGSLVVDGALIKV